MTNRDKGTERRHRRKRPYDGRLGCKLHQWVSAKVGPVSAPIKIEHCSNCGLQRPSD